MSAVRAAFYPDEGNPVYSGQMLWRGVVEWEPVFDGRTCVMVGHNDLKAVVYPISEPARKRGRAQLNWVAERRLAGIAAAESADWNRRGDPADFVGAFADWRFDWLDVPAMFAATRAGVRISDGRSHAGAAVEFRPRHVARRRGARDAPERLQRRVAGDSRRHRARRRAARRSDRSSRHCALTRRERLEPTAKLTLDNRETGPERVLQMVEDRCPNGFDDIHDHFSHAELQEMADRYKKLAGFNRDALTQSAHPSRGGRA